MENVIVIGTGDLYNRFLAPSLESLQEQKIINVLTTIDIKERGEVEYLNDLEHRVREPHDKNLSELIYDLKDKDPIVILGHSNNLHLADAKDLVYNGFRVMIEKPYVTDNNQLQILKDLISRDKEKVFLLDYYLKRKTIPLLLLGGVIKEDSFYLNTEQVLQKKETEFDNLYFSGKLSSIIGDPVKVNVNILETDPANAKLEHRGDHLIDRRKGGGMIQDLGMHAVIPLFALKEYLGDIEKSFEEGNVKIGECEEFCNFAEREYGIPTKHIAETYAEIEFKTSKNVPLEVRVGKYIGESPEKKNIIIQGTKGRVNLDMAENVMFMYKDNKLIEKIELINTKSSRYYPVIRSGIEYFTGSSPFKIDSVKNNLDSQEFVLNILNKAKDSHAVKLYRLNESPSRIFTHHAIIGELGKLDRRDLNSYYDGYINYLSTLMKSVDKEKLNNIADVFLDARRNGNTIYFIGNGGSASIASHFAQDFSTIGRKLGFKVFKSMSLTDNASAITAYANDYGYDKVFSTQMQEIFEKGDVLVAISSSGNSPNIIDAVNLAKDRGGTIIGLVGFDGGKLLESADYTFHIKAQRGEYGPVEDGHMIFDHLVSSYLYYRLMDDMNKK